jgi:hypothetical protein
MNRDDGPRREVVSVQLRPGRTCDEAIKFLDDIQQGSLNTTRNAVPMLGANGFVVQLKAAVSQYERWVDDTARLLREIFSDSSLEHLLRSERYWMIVTTDPTSQHLASVIRAELNDLSGSFMSAANCLRGLKERYKAMQGRCFVLDTNDFLHYQRMDQLPWRSTYGQKVRIVVPHIVLDEIDRKSYETESKTHKRARGVYGMLERLLDNMDGEYIAKLQDGTPCLFLLDEPGHLRLGNNDDEIVSRAGYLQQYLSPGAVTVMTSDIGMRGRAISWRLKAEKLLDNFRISGDGKSSANVTAALDEME